LKDDWKMNRADNEMTVAERLIAAIATPLFIEAIFIGASLL